MKKIKSYTGIWNVEKVLYAINDFNLPFPVTFTQITWFVITEFIIIVIYRIEYKNRGTTNPYNSLIPLTWLESP